MAGFDRETSAEIARLASAVLDDRNSTLKGRRLAGSALAQTRPSTGGVNPAHTSAELAALAGAVLDDRNSTPTERELAGSVLSQAAPRR